MAVEVQQGDVKLFHTDDNGDILVENGLVRMAGDLETSAYLSLFGGNEEDDGLDDNSKNWWGNFIEIDPTKHYRSELQNLLRAVPLTTGILRRAEDAAQRDLDWFVTVGAATSVKVEATIPALNTIKLNIQIIAIGSESSFEFIENWRADTLPQVPLEGDDIISVTLADILGEDGTPILAEDGTPIQQEQV